MDDEDDDFSEEKMIRNELKNYLSKTANFTMSLKEEMERHR
jgi:hypothetical protein